MEHGGHVPCGVTAHGSPGGPLQFDRLEAALAAKLHSGVSRNSYVVRDIYDWIAILIGGLI